MLHNAGWVEMIYTTHTLSKTGVYNHTCWQITHLVHCVTLNTLCGITQKVKLIHSKISTFCVHSGKNLHRTEKIYTFFRAKFGKIEKIRKNTLENSEK